MRGIRFTAHAEKDIDTILAYTMAMWGDEQTQAYVDGLYRLLDLIAANPDAGRPRPEFAPGLRSFPYREHLVFYMLFDGALLVIRVLGARQNIRPGNFRR